MNKTKKQWLGSPPSPVLSSVSPPRVIMTTVSLRDGEEPIFPLPHLNKGMMNVSVQHGVVRAVEGQGLVWDNNA